MEMHSWWACKLIQPLWTTVWRFLKKLEIKLTHDSAIPLLGIYYEKNHNCKRHMYIVQMFIAALFTVSRTCKIPRCPSVDEWIKKLWYIYNGILLGHKKWLVSFSEVNEPRVHYMSEVSQKENIKYVLAHTFENGIDGPICRSGIET